MVQVAVGGVIWSYQEIGSGSGAPLLILHGWGRSGAEWVEMAKELSLWSGRKAYVLDLPGFGGTSLANIASIEEYTNLIFQFCAYLGLKQIMLIGHSLGGRVGIVMAATHPSLVEKLILVDPAGVKPRSINRTILWLLARLFSWVPLELRRAFVTPLMDEDYRSSPALHMLYRSVVGEDLRKYLGKIKCLVEVVWGEEDLILPLSLTRIYREKLKDVKIRVVWGAGHDPHLTHYRQTLAILEEVVL